MACRSWPCGRAYGRGLARPDAIGDRRPPRPAVHDDRQARTMVEFDVRSGDLLRVHRHNIRSLESIAAAIVFAAAYTLQSHLSPNLAANSPVYALKAEGFSRTLQTRNIRSCFAAIARRKSEL